MPRRPPPPGPSRHPPARKRFGQHFLAAPDIVARIVQAAGLRPGDRVLEIGPGRGVLTRALVAAGGAVTALELDRDLAALLRSDLPDLHLVEGDALTIDLPSLCPGDGWIVCSNLPYNVGTPILERLLAEPLRFPRLVVMLQKEVGERLAAAPDSSEYGSLSVYTQARARVERCFLVPPGAFRPPPKVDSVVLRLEALPVPDLGGVDPAHHERVVRAGFALRRKTLRNALSRVWSGEEIDRACAAAGIDPGLRAEVLGLEAWTRLAAGLPVRERAPGRADAGSQRP